MFMTVEARKFQKQQKEQGVVFEGKKEFAP